MKNDLPNFIVVGFPKCGSTSLHYYLNEHPNIFMPKQKELHYFTNNILSKLKSGPGDSEVNQFNVSSFIDYQKKFKDSKNHKAIGEVSPSYINYPSCIRRIKDTLGEDIKIIIMLRDPVKRAYSNYLHLVRESREDLSFYEALNMEVNRKELGYSDFWYYSFNSSYFDKVKAFKSEFADVLLVKMESLHENANEALKEIYSFLEVDDCFVPKNLDKVYNLGGVFEENIITSFFFKQSKLRSLIKKTIPITPKMKHIKQNLISGYKKTTPSIDKKSEDFLIDLLKEEVLELSETYDLNISDWNPRFMNS